jgi:hypothetical protein
MVAEIWCTYGDAAYVHVCAGSLATHSCSAAQVDPYLRRALDEE